MTTHAASKHLTVTAPWDGRELGTIPVMSAEDVSREIDIAARALETAHPQHERAAVLERATRLLQDRANAFAELIRDEAGKPIALAQAEVQRAIDTLRYSAIEARTLAGDVVPMAGTAGGAVAHGMTLRRPIGVVAAISPFNFPLNLVAHKLGPAIAAGCPVVHKPASATPLTSVMLHELLHDAGMPEQRLRLVVGPGREVGGALAADERIRHLSFTGSSDVGWTLPAAAPHARVSLELGNSTPLLIFDDADLEAATDAVAAHGFGYAGQSCISIQRVLVERASYEDVCELLRLKVADVRYGDPADASVVCGPLIDEGARDAVLTRLQDARDAGATLLAGGDHDGLVIEPTVLRDVDPAWDVSREELFGPAVVLTPFEGEAEGVVLANGTRYGLQAGAYTTNVHRALRLAEQLDFGSVTINVSPTFRVDQMPYGGTKDSGNTKEGPSWSVRELTQERLVLLGRD